MGDLGDVGRIEAGTKSRLKSSLKNNTRDRFQRPVRLVLDGLDETQFRHTPFINITRMLNSSKWSIKDSCIREEYDLLQSATNK